MKNALRRTLLISVSLTLFACLPEGTRDAASAGDESPAETLEVFTVNYPLTYFAERIVGDQGTVVLPAPPDVDPANWSPDAETIIEYQGADLILLNGAGYAGWMANATLPQSRLVDTTAGVADRLIEIEDTVTHSHGPTGEHSHGGTAFTTWLDLEIAIEQARAVFDALVRARPELETPFRDAFEALEADLTEFDAKLEAATEALAGRPVLFSHPVYQYFERRYELNGYSVHWEPDELPGEARWRELQSVLRQHPANVMIWEAEPLPETRRRLSDLGVDSIVFEPGGNRPAAGDLLDLLEEGTVALSSQ